MNCFKIFFVGSSFRGVLSFTLIDSGTIIDSYVQILEGTKIGKNNRIHSNTVIGGDPQDLKFKGE